MIYKVHNVHTIILAFKMENANSFTRQIDIGLIVLKTIINRTDSVAFAVAAVVVVVWTKV